MNLEKQNKIIAYWLLTGIGMVIIQIALGGITRLTGSGLSITEWNVVTGTLPPLNNEAWMLEFQKYQQTPQYQLLNNSFTINNFKFIFFWEWFHRVWARLIGFVFALPFIFFVVKKWFQPQMIKPLLFLFILGALQGAVGWIMVASGLTGDAVYVKPTRLALHFVFAIALLCYTYWFYLKLTISSNELIKTKSLQKFTTVLIIFIFIQLAFGALMAGHKAANVAPSWPDINGDLVPLAAFSQKPFLINFIENKILIHFTHRSLAYLIFILSIIWSFKLKKLHTSELARKYLYLPLCIVFIQIILGISSLIASKTIVANDWGSFEWIAILHQLTGMLLILSFIFYYFLMKSTKAAN